MKRNSKTTSSPSLPPSSSSSTSNTKRKDTITISFLLPITIVIVIVGLPNLVCVNNNSKSWLPHTPSWTIPPSEASTTTVTTKQKDVKGSSRQRPKSKPKLINLPQDELTHDNTDDKRKTKKKNRLIGIPYDESLFDNDDNDNKHQYK